MTGKHYSTVLKELIDFRLDNMNDINIHDYNIIRELIKFSITMRLDITFINSIKKRFANIIAFDNDLEINK